MAEARDWKIGHKRRITRNEYLMAQHGLWNLVREKVLQVWGELPKEAADVIREYKAMHEEKYLSSWLREEGREEEERIMEIGKETKEEMGKKRRREEEKEENETGSVVRRCVGFVSAQALDIFSQGEDLDSCGGLSWEDLLEKPEDLSDWVSVSLAVVSALPFVTDVHVTDVPVSTSSESCSFSKKRCHSLAVTQEEMRLKGSQARGHFEVEDQNWSARDRTVIARTKQYLEES